MPKVRAVRSFVWHGPRDVNVGDVLDVDDFQAVVLVDGYHHCVYVGDAPPPPSAMVVDAEPRIHNRDPVRRRR